jgi:hypothetical protein
MIAKPRPNHAQYLAVLRSMTPAQRLHKAFELTAMTRQLFWAGLKRRFPNRSEAELRELYVKRLLECSKRNS